MNEKQLQQKFELFWSYYPLPTYKKKAWEQFKKINPDDALFELIIQTLIQHKEKASESKLSNALTPYSISADEWLTEKQWHED